MNIVITSRKFKARESLKDFVKQEVGSLEKFYDEIMDVEVVLSYRKPDQDEKIAELIVNVPKSTLKASETTKEFEQSVRAATEKIVRQLKKLKTKRNVHL